MKKILPWLAFIAGLAAVASGLFLPGKESAYDLKTFGRIPVLTNGRIKPLDTVARTSLLVFQDRQTVYLEDESEITPLQWLLDVAFKPEQADTYRTFTIDNPDLLTLVGKTEDSVKIHYDATALRVLAIFDFVPTRYRRFTYKEISPHLNDIERQAQLALSIDPQGRNAFQRAVLSLYNRLVAYQQLKYSFVDPDSTDFYADLQTLQAELPKGIEAVRAKQAGQPHDEDEAKRMIEVVRRFDDLARLGSLFVVPPPNGGGVADWKKVGQSLLELFRDGEPNEAVTSFALMGEAWRNSKPDQFNTAVRRYHDKLLGSVEPAMRKTDLEVAFNQAEPFYKCMLVFAAAFFVGVASWMFWPEILARSAFFLTLAAFLAATAGIITRMVLEGRPPVTNLYSSALFVGWAAVGLCLVLERIYRNGVGAVTAGAMGFCAFMIAHHLSFSGDTMEMMQAVLDSNFWLGTHVVVVTLGYASTFLSGFLGIAYIFLGVFTNWLQGSFARPRAANADGPIPIKAPAPRPAASKPETNGQAINRMIYGIICFATLFSLVGTILGGIWADQSWGRFWGWDPKENGALIIVLWNALILHARWGGLVKSRGLACLAVFGNIVTSWSWFGTNMLGIGLHSYGFMDAAFYWLMGFMICQVVIILIGALIPLEKWRSFRKQEKSPNQRQVVQPA